MKPKDKETPRNKCSPLDMHPENVDEATLINVLEILVASGKVNRDDILAAWKLAFTA